MKLNGVLQGQVSLIRLPYLIRSNWRERQSGRASVHNVSIVKDLQLGIGDTIQVYKANMIIPQIAENLTRSSNLEIPEICPACGQEAE